MSLHRALIIDDEPDIRELLELTLGRMDIDTDAAANIEEARGLLQEKQFDLCLTDMRLPDGNGIELVEHIQSHYPTLPVAVITAYGSMEAAVHALKAGAFDFVSKPVDLEMLRNLVNSAMKLSAPDTVIDRRSRDRVDRVSVGHVVPRIEVLPPSVCPSLQGFDELVRRVGHPDGKDVSRVIFPVVACRCHGQLTGTLGLGGGFLRDTKGHDGHEEGT